MNVQDKLKAEGKGRSETLRLFNIRGDYLDGGIIDKYIPTLREASKMFMSLQKELSDANIGATITLRSYVIESGSKKICVVKFLNGENVLRSSQILKTITVMRRKGHVDSKHAVQFQVRRKEK